MSHITLWTLDNIFLPPQLLTTFFSLYVPCDSYKTWTWEGRDVAGGTGAAGRRDLRGGTSGPGCSLDDDTDGYCSGLLLPPPLLRRHPATLFSLPFMDGSFSLCLYSSGRLFSADTAEHFGQLVYAILPSPAVASFSSFGTTTRHILGQEGLRAGWTLPNFHA